MSDKISPQDQRLIDEWLETHEVTKCPVFDLRLAPLHETVSSFTWGRSERHLPLKHAD